MPEQPKPVIDLPTELQQEVREEMGLPPLPSARERLLVKAKTMKLPVPPWTHAVLGEEKYCELARELGYFNPKTEQKNYRPDLDPTPYLDLIRQQHKQVPAPTT